MTHHRFFSGVASSSSLPIRSQVFFSMQWIGIRSAENASASIGSIGLGIPMVSSHTARHRCVQCMCPCCVGCVHVHVHVAKATFPSTAENCDSLRRGRSRFKLRLWQPLHCGCCCSRAGHPCGVKAAAVSTGAAGAPVARRARIAEGRGGTAHRFRGVSERSATPPRSRACRAS